MWPYRARRLSDLLDPQEVAFLLGQGIGQLLRSDVTLVEPGEGGQHGERALRRIDQLPGLVPPHESPFCHFFRHGKVAGACAFEGADAECARCEERFAARVLEARRVGAPADGAGITSGRCHMGLLDFAAPVVVRGQALAAVIAGRRVDSDEERARIAKRVGKLGKLTRAEVRSLEESGVEVAPAIRPHDEAVRERLLGEIPRIPRADPDLGANLGRFAGWLAALADSRYGLARREWEDGVIARLFPDGIELPQRRAAILKWVEGAVRNLHRELGNAHVALFARLPEALGKQDESLRLLAQSGLPEDERLNPRGADALMELDATSVVAHCESLDQCIERSIDAVSALISALRPAACPPSWKDLLTKSVFVAALNEAPGLEVVVAFGPAARGASAAAVAPQREDLGFLWRAARRIAERYLLAACESVRRTAAARLERIEEAAKARKPSGPLRPQRFDARKLLESALEGVRAAAERRRVTFDTKGLPERAMLEADRVKLRRVFDCVLRYIVEVALPDPERTRPSVLVSIRRDRRHRHRWALVFDVVGCFLTADDRRRLFAEKNGARRAPEAADHSAQGSDEGSGATLSFREAQQAISWHRGRLKIESERMAVAEPVDGSGTGAVAAERPPSPAPRWNGRTVFTIEIPERPPRHLPAPAASKTAGAERPARDQEPRPSR